ncbi:MAG: hypothetical protein RSA10_03745 [Bacilli bacterium]
MKSKENPLALKKELKKGYDLLNKKCYEEAETVFIKLLKQNNKDHDVNNGLLRSKTNDYNKYVEKDCFKELKGLFENAFVEITTSEKTKYDEYKDDCGQVDILKQKKLEIIKKRFLINVYEAEIKNENENLNMAYEYGPDGNKVRHVGDLIIGMFFFLCFIYNLFNIGILLLITIPFGIFGFITMYKFFETNYFKKGSVNLNSIKYSKALELSVLKIVEAKKQIKKQNEEALLVIQQKKDALSKIPTFFEKDIKEYVLDNEIDEANKMFKFLNNDGDENVFNNLSFSDIDASHLKKEHIERESSPLYVYINNIIKEKKRKYHNLSAMKNISSLEIFQISFAILISFLGMFVFFNKNIGSFYVFEDVRIEAFLISFIVGIITPFLYNINTGNHLKLSATYFDNLCCSVFGAMLTFWLVTQDITGKLNFFYHFIVMSIVMGFCLSGVVMIASTIKYVRLLKKIRG